MPGREMVGGVRMEMETSMRMSTRRSRGGDRKMCVLATDGRGFN